MESALKVYISLSQSNRAKIEAMIKVFDLSSIEIDTRTSKRWPVI